MNQYKEKITIAVLLLNLLFFTSCATLFNQSSTKVQVHSLDSITGFTVNKDSIIQKNNAKINVLRSVDDLVIYVKTDSIDKNVSISSQFSGAVYWDIALSPELFFIPTVVDYFLSKEKFYSYPQHIVIQYDKKKNTLKHLPYYKQESRIDVAVNFPSFGWLMPNVNQHLPKSAFSYLNTAGALHYYFKSNRAIGLEYAIGRGANTQTAAYYLDGSGEFFHNFLVKYIVDKNKLQLQTGLLWQYAEVKYGHLINQNNPDLQSIKGDTITYFKQKQNIGLHLSATYFLTKNIGLNLKYQPTFFSLYDNRLNAEYQHSIFVGIITHIPFFLR